MKIGSRPLIACGLVVLFLGAVFAAAQTRTRQLKRINREELLKNYSKTDSFESKKGTLPEKTQTASRQTASGPGTAAPKRASAPPTAAERAAAAKNAASIEDVRHETDDTLTQKTLGMTVWRMRPATPEDEVQLTDTRTGEKVTPIRVKSSTPLEEGDQVRLTIEAPRDGYLYAIDREKYTDGTLGPPVLIFPTRRLHGGDNAVTQDVTIEIPGIDDSPAHFTLRKTRPDLEEEVIIIIISENPLPGIKIGRNASAAPIALSEEQVASWTEDWAADFTRFDLDKGEGLPMKKSERQVATRTRALVHEDPKAQTVYYVPDHTAGEPMMITVPLVINDER